MLRTSDAKHLRPAAVCVFKFIQHWGSYASNQLKLEALFFSSIFWGQFSESSCIFVGSQRQENQNKQVVRIVVQVSVF